MSGGSFDYLCHIFDAEDVAKHLNGLADMADWFATNGYADLAAETNRIRLDWLAYESRTMAAVERMREVWKMVEWFTSADTGRESVTDAVAKYRGLDRQP